MLNIGQYRLQKDGDYFLGGGSFGQVYKALDTTTNEEVAIKCVPVDNDPDCLSEVKKEVEALEKVSPHENILGLLHSEIKNGFLYMVTNYCPLKDITFYIEYNVLSEDEKLDIILDCCKAVAHLHGIDPPVVHRDLKPENLLVVKPNHRRPYVRLCDFGLAKCTQRVNQMTKAMGTFCGSLGFMAPELYAIQQDGSGEYTKAVDVYSLGLLILAILDLQFEQKLKPLKVNGEELGRVMLRRYREGRPLSAPVLVSDSDSKEIHALKSLSSLMLNYHGDQRSDAQQVLSLVQCVVTGHRQSAELQSKQHQVERLETHIRQLETQQDDRASRLEKLQIEHDESRLQSRQLQTQMKHLQEAQEEAQQHASTYKHTSNTATVAPQTDNVRHLHCVKVHELGYTADVIVTFCDTWLLTRNIDINRLELHQLSQDALTLRHIMSSTPPGGCESRCYKEVLPGGKVLVRKYNVDDAVTYMLDNQLNIEHQYAGVSGRLRGCLHDCRLAYLQQTEHGDRCIRLYNQQHGDSLTLQPPAGEAMWSYYVSVCDHPTTHQIAVTDKDNKSLDLYSQEGEHERHVDLKYIPLDYHSVTCDEDHIYVATHNPATITCHPWHDPDYRKTYSRQQLGLTTSERVAAISATNTGRLIVAVRTKKLWPRLILQNIFYVNKINVYEITK